LANDRRVHWDHVYGTKPLDEVSWYQAHPRRSLELIERTGKGPAASVIDIGAGASGLVDALLAAGFADLAVLDISAEALARTQARLGDSAEKVSWICADITSWRPSRTFDIWHDRAVFHFLASEEDRAGYRAALGASLGAGGQAIIGTFASDGPERCSGLPVVRYEPESLAAELGDGFQLVESLHEEHLTPSRKVQRFQFSRFIKR
jgi:SAM-dependent methyltransferase